MSSSDVSLCSAEEMVSMSPGVPRSEFPVYPRCHRTIPEILASRESYGLSTSSIVKRYGVDCPLLSYRGAWNAARLQNMILAVGPGTPAAVVMTTETTRLASSSDSSDSGSASSSDSSASIRSEEVDILEDAEDVTLTGAEMTTTEKKDGEDDTDEPELNRVALEARRCRRRIHLESDDDDDDDDGDHNINGSDDENSDAIAQRIAESALMEWYGADEDDEDDDDEDIGSLFRATQQQCQAAPSMRHGGCINTAAWLDCGWRLSTSSTGLLSSHAEAVVTSECPTQLITSGDDHTVKFFDVRHAMGMTSPLSGGYCTLCPFSAPTIQGSWEQTKQNWKSHYACSNSTSEKMSSRHNHQYSGSVIPLATLHTGHRGNVFHVTPVNGRPGKVATCGADGYLRLIDLEESGGGNGDASCSTVIVSPEYDDDLGGLLPAGMLSLRPGMCFSHHFLNQNTGLLCSERGLRRFDLRLPPREQSTQSIMGGPFRGCKACAIWSSSSSNSFGEEDSAYVFAGGSSADVALCDLRMTSEEASGGNRVVQYYRPKGLEAADHVSVSGLDLSRDKQELLVSYESDQIYTFPVFSQLKSAAGPTLDDLEHSREKEDPLDSVNGSGKNKTTKVLNELATYGGHLNRFTFLKNAKYAGPNDEYICTGSDSGHAWIYEKATGCVVSLLNADHSTCNGVIPHPSLPIFITYGIDSTAKLWRGTIPVDSDVDDSPEGRAKSFRSQDFALSPVTKKWNEVQHVLKILESEECKEAGILPDQIPNTKDILHTGRFGRSYSRREGGGPKICNDLHNLPDLLRQNLYACLRSLVDGDDEPVESDVEDLKRRVSLIRLRHQTDQLGLSFNPSLPWMFQGKQGIRKRTGQGGHVVAHHMLHPADLVPDNPSDWISYDYDTCQSPWDFGRYFNLNDYEDFYRERYVKFEDLSFPRNGNKHVMVPWLSKEQEVSKNGVHETTQDEIQTESGDRILTKDGEKDVSVSDLGDTSKVVSSSSEEEDGARRCDRTTIDTLLYDTILVLKDGGNEALQAGEFNLAAHRYDKAIQYGAVAFMTFPVSESHFANGRREKLKESGGYQLEWTPLVKVLVETRLNLALLMLKPQFSHPEQAANQASIALHELKPFCAVKGKIMKGSKLDSVHRDNETDETFHDATTLLVKGYFRLGTAHYKMKKYPEAIRNYENSIKSSQQIKAKPDALVLRRLSEAKRENKRKNKRHRKKFKLAFGANEHQRKKSSHEERLEDS